MDLPKGMTTNKDELVTLEEAKRDTNPFSKMAEGPKRTKGIVDLDDITERIITFLEYMEKPEIKKMEESDEKAFVSHMMEKFVDNFDKYFYIFTKLLETKNRKENINEIMNMIETLRDVKEGKKNESGEFLKFQKSKAEKYKIPKHLWRK
jgi:hypothetical protein